MFAALRSRTSVAGAAMIAAVWLLSMLLVSSAQAQGLLTNGDAEAGDLTGWTVSGLEIDAVMVQSQTAGDVLPFEGSYF